MTKVFNKYKIFNRVIAVVIIIAFVCNDVALATQLNTPKEVIHTLSPVSRFETTEVLRVERRGNDFSLKNKLEGLEISGEFKEKAVLLYISTLIGGILDRFGSKISTAGLISLIGKEVRHVDVSLFRWDKITQEGKTFCLKYLRADGTSGILRYYLPSDNPPEAQGKESVAVGSGTARVIVEGGWKRLFQDVSAADKDENDIDPRPYFAGLLHKAYIEHDMAVKKIINPGNKPLTAVYGAAGADISNFLLSTNATEAYFISDYHKLGLTRLKKKDLMKCFDSEDPDEYIDKNLFKSLYEKKLADGSVSRLALGTKQNVIAAIAFELKAMGVDLKKVEVDTYRGHPRLKFKWRYKSVEEREYSVTLVGADVTRPAGYKQVLEGKKIDIYYQRAANALAEEYGKGRGSYMGFINGYLKQGGYFVTDDHFIDSTWEIDVDRSSFFPLPLKAIEVPGIAKFRENILEVREKYFIPSSMRRTQDNERKALNHYGWYVRIRQKPAAADVLAGLKLEQKDKGPAQAPDKGLRQNVKKKVQPGPRKSILTSKTLKTAFFYAERLPWFGGKIARIRRIFDLLLGEMTAEQQNAYIRIFTVFVAIEVFANIIKAVTWIASVYFVFEGKYAEGALSFGTSTFFGGGTRTLALMLFKPFYGGVPFAALFATSWIPVYIGFSISVPAQLLYTAEHNESARVERKGPDGNVVVRTFKKTILWFEEIVAGLERMFMAAKKIALIQKMMIKKVEKSLKYSAYGKKEKDIITEHAAEFIDAVLRYQEYNKFDKKFKIRAANLKKENVDKIRQEGRPVLLVDTEEACRRLAEEVITERILENGESGIYYFDLSSFFEGSVEFRPKARNIRPIEDLILPEKKEKRRPQPSKKHKFQGSPYAVLVNVEKAYHEGREVSVEELLRMADGKIMSVNTIANDLEILRAGYVVEESAAGKYTISRALTKDKESWKKYLRMKMFLERNYRDGLITKNSNGEKKKIIIAKLKEIDFYNAESAVDNFKNDIPKLKSIIEGLLLTQNITATKKAVSVIMADGPEKDEIIAFIDQKLPAEVKRRKKSLKITVKPPITIKGDFPALEKLSLKAQKGAKKYNFVPADTAFTVMKYEDTEGTPLAYLVAYPDKIGRINMRYAVDEYKRKKVPQDFFDVIESHLAEQKNNIHKDSRFDVPSYDQAHIMWAGAVYQRELLKDPSRPFFAFFNTKKELDKYGVITETNLENVLRNFGFSVITSSTQYKIYTHYLEKFGYDLPAKYAEYLNEDACFQAFVRLLEEASRIDGERARLNAGNLEGILTGSGFKIKRISDAYKLYKHYLDNSTVSRKKTFDILEIYEASLRRMTPAAAYDDLFERMRFAGAYHPLFTNKNLRLLLRLSGLPITSRKRKPEIVKVRSGRWLSAQEPEVHEMTLGGAKPLVISTKKDKYRYDFLKERAEFVLIRCRDNKNRPLAYLVTFTDKKGNLCLKYAVKSSMEKIIPQSFNDELAKYMKIYGKRTIKEPFLHEPGFRMADSMWAGAVFQEELAKRPQQKLIAFKETQRRLKPYGEINSIYLAQALYNAGFKVMRMGSFDNLYTHYMGKWLDLPAEFAGLLKATGGDEKEAFLRLFRKAWRKDKEFALLTADNLAGLLCGVGYPVSYMGQIFRSYDPAKDDSVKEEEDEEGGAAVRKKSRKSKKTVQTDRKPRAKKELDILDQADIFFNSMETFRKKFIYKKNIPQGSPYAVLMNLKEENTPRSFTHLVDIAKGLDNNIRSGASLKDDIRLLVAGEVGVEDELGNYVIWNKLFIDKGAP